jgi:hypothetical protein
MKTCNRIIQLSIFAFFISLLRVSSAEVVVSTEVANYFSNLNVQNDHLTITPKGRIAFFFDEHGRAIKKRREGITSPGETLVIKNDEKIVFSENHTGLKITPIVDNGFTYWIFEIQETFPDLKINYQGLKVDPENHATRMNMDELCNYTESSPKMKEAAYHWNGIKIENKKYDFSMSGNEQHLAGKENISTDGMPKSYLIFFLFLVCLSIFLIIKLLKRKK